LTGKKEREFNMSKPKVAIVIPCRGDKELHGTMADIREKAKGVDVSFYVVNDDSGAGTQACRHAGIAQAKEPYIITTDAHMRFKEGTLETLVANIKKHPNDILCAKCHHQPEYTFESNPYCGAAWVFKDENKFSERHPVSAKWRTSDRSGIIGCVMGACYAFRRKRYEEIGSPWQYGTGWGKDEETLCLINWLMGGESRLVNCQVSHLEQKPTQMPYRQNARDVPGRIATRWRLMHVSNMPESEKIELYKWFQGDSTFKQIPHQVAEMIDTKRCEPLRKLLENAPRTFQEWKEWWLPMKERRVPYKGKMRNRKTENPKKPVENPPQERQPRVVVVERGTPCPHCGEEFDHKVENTYPNGNRGVKCVCGKRFIKFRRA
jgi:glycosyltransferase involved in cell wall biosynthesis